MPFELHMTSIHIDVFSFVCAGTFINVWWPAENSWFPGYAGRYDINRGLFVHYVDGDKRYHDLTSTKYHILTRAADCDGAAVKKRKFTEAEIGSVKSTVECSICYEIFADPHSLPCTHTFCKPCIQQSFENYKNCPICKEDFLLREARPNPTIKKLCDIFAPASLPTTASTSLASASATTCLASATFTVPVLSSDPLQALAQITGAGTYKCSTCGGRKTARSHKCARPCPPQYM